MAGPKIWIRKVILVNQINLFSQLYMAIANFMQINEQQKQNWVIQRHMIYSRFLQQMVLHWPTRIWHLYISFLEELISMQDFALIWMQGTQSACAWNMWA